MNATRLFSLVVTASLLAAAMLLVGCGTTHQVYVPTERSYQDVRHNRQLAYDALFRYGYGAGVTIPFGVATPAFYVAQPRVYGNLIQWGGQGVRGVTRNTATQAVTTSVNPRLHPSFAEQNLRQIEALYQAYCWPSAPKAGELSRRDCQDLADERNHLQEEMSVSLFREEATCHYQEVNGRQSRVCQETERGSWRKK